MRSIFIGLLTVALVSAGSAEQRVTAPAAATPPVSTPSLATRSNATSSIATQRALLDQYCSNCHNDDDRVAGLSFTKIDLAHIGKNAELWEKAVMKLRGGLMPPPGNRQPDKAAVNAFVGWLETSLDAASAAAPNPGTVALHRLNRSEYANSVRELFGIEVDPAALLPTDDISEGFDNIANVLKVSPSFLDQYVVAARTVSLQALGDPAPTAPVRVTLRGVPVEADGLAPLGTQPGTVAEHFFPADAGYQFQGGNGSVITVDGVRVSTTSRVTLKAGLHKVGVSTPVRSFAESDGTLQAFIPGGGGGPAAGPRGGGGGAGGLTVTGPYDPTSPVLETPSRQKIFVCKPTGVGDEEACARQIFAGIARRAYRRPVTDADLDAPLAFFKDGRSRGNFEAGIQTGLMTIIASPKFLYRAERTPATAKPGTVRISDLDLAARLSFFIWSQIPDDELLDLAIKGQLSNPVTLDKQVHRMLADPRSRALTTNFVFEWLRVRDVDKIDPDAVLFPNFDAGLKTAFKREMELFVDSILRENRNVTELITADYTFLNERLALHYGIPDVRGTQFRRVTLPPDSNRRGILGKGAILLATSYPNRTSVVLRGNWILENVLGTPPAAPPPNVEPFKENKEGVKALTIRAIMEQHRANPTCNACHGIIDPLGFGLENFDAIGSWRIRDRDAGTPIDATGRLVDGSPVAGPADLRAAIVKHSDQFVQTMTGKMLMYALGRGTEYFDMPLVRKITRDSAKNNYNFSSLVLGIVRSPAFQMKQVPDAAKPAVKAD